MAQACTGIHLFTFGHRGCQRCHQMAQGPEAQVRPFSSLESLPQPHPQWPWSQSFADCQGLSWNSVKDGAPPCRPWHTPGTVCPLGHLADTPRGPHPPGRILLRTAI